LYGGSCTKLEKTNQASLKKNKEEEEEEELLLFILFLGCICFGDLIIFLKKLIFFNINFF
jgi:hypothetical protein